MKQGLEFVYRELAAGRLSQPEALSRIRALQRAGQEPDDVTLLAAPQWRLAELTPAPAQAADTQWLVLLYGIEAATAQALAQALAPAEVRVLAQPALAAPGEAYAQLALDVFAAVREALRSKPQAPVRVQLAVAGQDGDEWAAGLAGLFETAQLENPLISGQIVFVPADGCVESLTPLLRGERKRPRDRLVRHDARGRWLRGWNLLEPAARAAREPFKEDGVYLITGGLGGLGRLFAQDILGRTTRAKVVLAGRREADEAARERLRALHAGDDGRLAYRAFDVADAEQVERAVADIVAEYGRLDGIVHSAGVLRDDFIIKKEAPAFAEVLAAKVAGSVNLDRASRALDLDFLLLFSSIASWAGNLGQADYAAANGFMERFAEHRNAQVAAGERRGRTLAIAWPHWRDGGMHVDAGSMAALERRTGLRSMHTAAGMQALYLALAGDSAHVLALHGDAAAIRRALDGDAAAAPAPVANAAPAAPAPVEDLPARVREFLRGEFAAVLKLPAERIEARAPLEKYGIDSILAMSLTDRLEASFGALPKTLFFEYLSIEELAQYFLRSHAPALAGLFADAAPAPVAAASQIASAAPSQAVSQPAASRRRQRFAAPATASAPAPAANEPIAIVGLSGRYPEARDLHAYWTNLSEGRDCIVEVPASRWNWREHYSDDRTREGAHYSKWGGFIEGVDEFDPRFFNISPREARSIDPQERLFLQHAWMAIEDAGYTRASLQIPHDGRPDGQVGVYAGVMYGEYNLSGSLASIANRVSYVLNLHGPSLTLDTMCSSSLTALHLACQDLRSGRTSLALAGGVNVSIHPNKYAMLSGGQFISGDGHCQSFGEGGDGYIPGEGVGVAVLKRLSEAQRDGNHIYAVIRGSALNHGGKTNGYTVPNPQAQADAIRQALGEAGVDPRDVSYIEAHGTGTKLGDPIEIAALTKAFHEGLPAPQRATGYCRIGSAKSNIGHCESAAGIAGVSKVLLQMKHGAIAPSLHSARLNPHIDFAATPFVVNQRLSPWQAPSRDGRAVPRIAGVSSFGAGGSNAHVVIEEYVEPARVPRAAAAMLVPLSARTAGQLAERVADLLAWIERGESFEPADLAFTLQVGRESMEERVAFVADTPQRLCDQLRAVLGGGALPAGGYRGQVKPHRDLLDVDCGPIDAWLSQARLEELAQAWVKGAAPQWRQLYPAGAMPRLMSLPTYPFARERYWVAPLASQPVAATAAATLHPLVHANTSGLDGLGYASAFCGDEAFVGGAPAELPPLLALEMVRFAAANAYAAAAGVWEISGLAWDEPMSVGGGRGLRVAVYPVAEDAVDIEIRADDESGDAVHAQARAAWIGDDALASLDAAQLRSNLQRIDGALPAGIAEAFAGQGEWLLRWTPSAPEAAAVALPPALLAALSAWLRDAFAAAQFETLARARVLRACGGEAWIQIRRAAADSVDIEVCDTQGAVCAQLHGLRYRTLAVAAAPVAPLQAAAALPAVAPALSAAPAPAAIAPREIDLGIAPSREASAAPAMPPARGKPTGIVLAASVEVPRAPAAAKGKVVLTHATVAVAGASAVAGDVRLFDLGEGVLRLEWSGQDLAAQAGALVHALHRAAQEPSIKALLLSGASAQTWRGDRAACNAAVAQNLFAAVAAFPYPVIAALPAEATGAGWLLGAVSDFMLLAEQGRYGFADAERGLLPGVEEDALVRERLGERLADDFLYGGRDFSGAELRGRGWSCRIVDAAHVGSDAEALARELARKPQLALRLLKAHLAERTIGLANALAEVVPPLAQRSREAGLVELDPDAAGGAGALAQTLADAIERAGADCSALVVAIAARASWSAVPTETAQLLAQALSASPVPLIAAFEGPADGVDALLGLWCDAAVYRDDAAYGVAGLALAPELDRQAAVLAELRFGAALARDLCLSAQAYSGSELHARCATLTAAGAGETRAAAQALAGAWRHWPQAQLRDWTQARRARVRDLLEAAPHWSLEPADAAAAPPTVPTAVALRSDVVAATVHPDGVVLIELRDRDAKNMFSPALVDGLKQAFDYVAATPACKAVVLSGYDNYFATGGTRDTLLAIQQGQARFTDETVFQSPMDCPLPVIAALQGHAIGGGWSFGLFADLALFAEESRYLSPYMGYGFTPGAGSTLMFPRQLGHDLARESLLTAQELSGRALRERALAWPVLPRRDLVAAALAQASAIARQPRGRLQALKRVWTQAPRAAREELYRREVAMHERTFVGDVDTLQRIQNQFAAPQDAAPAPAAATPAADASVLERIRQMLAQELFLQAEEIDDDAQFIDLGLDSITGVTWIRRINAHYGIEIEATKVYSLPTLTRLGRHIAEVAGQGAPAAPVAAAPASVPAPATVAVVSSATPDDSASLAEVAAVLRELLARELHLQAQEIDDATQFIDLGLDSITGVTWVRKINERYRLEVEATKVYSHPTLAAMARLVREEAVRAGSVSEPTAPAPASPMAAVAPQAAATNAAPAPLRERAKLVSWRHRAAAPMRAATFASASATTAPTPVPAQAFEPIAVIGMAGRFPKAPDLETFWHNLVEGRDCIDEVPQSRWRLRDYYQAGAPAPGRTNSRWLGVMEDADRFDPLFFNISPTEAECMDPQQRVFLQASWHCLENAGYDPQALSGKQCGVFVGCGPSDYLQAAGERRLSAQGFTGAATSILAARIAYFLNLRGPCVSIDTACSSSLVAIANACDSLNAGHSDLALAGGVYVMAGPSMHVMTAQAGMLSADGRCHTFDQDANGFVPGEAVGVLMLKRLRDAERDGDRIDAVIQGWGVNQDGKTNGITAPNEDAQSELLRSVYRRFGIDPAGIGLIEAHGTGTKLGDPIEIAGLKAAFAPFTQAENFCALGSVKSNIGHCLTGAGAAGVIKLALALQHKHRPPTIHFRKRNEHIQLDGSPFYVNDRLGDWPAPAGGERRGAISSFGFSGTNAHLVLAEYLAPARAEAVAMRAPDGRIAVPLSARNEEQLREQAQQLLAFLRRHPRTDLTELAYTLQSGREAMGERLGLLVASNEELAARLEAFLAGDSAQDGVYVGQVKRHREGMRLIGQDPEVRALIVEKWLGQRRLGKLLELWSKGLELDWNLMYGADKPRRIALPGYPFARQRYWIEAEAAADTAPQDAPHPLLHRNVSLLSGQRYRSDFRGDEFFFQPDADGRPVVATGALLEMARGAVAAASADQPAALAVELRGLGLGPAAMAGELTVELAANAHGGIDWRICGADPAVSAPAASAPAEGEAWLVAPEDEDRIDAAALRARCADPHALDEATGYARLADAGWRPGAALRALRRFERGDAEALAQLAVPACARERQDGYGLHPSLLEAALHAAALFADGAPMPPLALESIALNGGGESELSAWVRHAEAGAGTPRLDIDLFDAEGRVRARLRGLELAQAEQRAALSIATPVWDRVDDRGAPARVAASERVLVIGAEPAQADALRAHYPDAALSFADAGTEASEAFAESFRAEAFDRLLWIVNAQAAPQLSEESIVADQERGLMRMLRIARGLAAAGLEQRPLHWDVVSLNALAPRRGDLAEPVHAGLQGLCGSMAEAYPHWTLRLLDLPALSTQALAALRALPARNSGSCLAWRDGEWFAQSLIGVRGLDAAAVSPYRSQGVYVVIGGAGGIGELWTRHVIEQCQANVIWIGRRPLDETIRAKLEAMRTLGKAPEYIQADASSREQLEAAYRRIKREHPAIHGVIHSAVGAFDQSLKSVSEADFRAILSVKIDASVRIAQVFAGEALDFAVFFSSNAAFVRGAGMAGYSAGCTFKDAYAQRLDRQWPCAVKVVNWGYWSVGAGEALTDAMKQYFQQTGHRPLAPEEGMRALDAFLASDLRQVSIAKSTRPGAQEWTVHYPPAAAAPAEALAALRVPAAAAAATAAGKAGAQMEPLLRRWLRAIVDATAAPAPAYARWLAESRKLAASFGLEGGEDLAELRREWDAAMELWLRDAGRSELCRLVDRCIGALPQILSGQRKATDVLFPESSLTLVENVYKTDVTSLAYNGALRESLIAAVRARLAAQPGARLRLLEIGAGTGATTVGLLQALNEHREHIAEYCYTDISRAFLLHAQEVYAPDAPYLRTQLFNAELPLAGQGIDAGAYDFVIAANVIHATGNIRNTLRNAKAVLRAGGALLMNEISEHSLCGHLTFGLLDGWWLNEDEAVRIPGSPGLYPAAWQRVLEEEGFEPVAFPCADAHAAGQQIVLAVSDGRVRQRLPAAPVAAVVPRVAPVAAPMAVVAAPQTDAAPDLRAKTAQLCRQLIGAALKIEPAQIDPSEPLESYGIDSIVIGLVNQKLQQHFDDIGATLLYEHRTVDALAGHLVRTQHARLRQMFGTQIAAEPAPASAAPLAPTAAIRPQAQDDAALREQTLRLCKRLFADALKLDIAQIDPAEPLERYGIDSIIVGTVNQQLQQRFGDIGSTVLFQCRTVEALAQHLLDHQREALRSMFRVAAPAAPTARAAAPAAPTQRAPQRIGLRSPAPAPAQAAARDARPQPIAVIGLSGTYPQAGNLDEFWQNLKSGRDSVGEIPARRWSLDGFYEADEQRAVEASKSYCKWGGFVDQFAQFDSLFFGIPPREALNMDPQERMFLQAAWGALEDAGYTRAALRERYGRKVGVFAGITRAGYNLYRTTHGRQQDKFWPRTSFGSVANRLSYFLDINGPSLPVDTMCSSSLTAIHEACEHIHNGDCELAFAGGVNLYLHPTSYVDMSSQHMLSPDGRCKSFGAGGNGFVPGEGVGVVLLKRLDRAIADGDCVHGVILATHVNHGGKTNGFTVPNPTAQAELVRRALDKAGLDAREVSYIEAHGTGTELGDPIEVAGLQQAFAQDSQDTGYCKLGSAKSNIGHLEAAAGIAGLTKVLLQLRHGQIAPTLHAATTNPHIAFAKTAFEVNQTLAPWQRPRVDGRERPRIAGISSFGAGGANAHVIVQEFVAPAAAAYAHSGPYLVPLSARTPEQLQQKASDLLDFLQGQGADADLAAIAYSLQVGREAMEERLGWVVDSVEQLAVRLSACVYGESGEGAHRGQAQRNSPGLGLFAQDDELREAIDKWIARGKYDRLLELWVKGLELDWNRLYGAQRPRRVALPTYPFARDEYWIDSVEAAAPARAAEPAAGGEVADIDRIEQVIGMIDAAAIDAREGVELLKRLV